MFGLLYGDFLEVKCNSKFCGHRSGRVVVFHVFDLNTGQMVRTKRFQDPRRREDGRDDPQHG